MARSRQPISLSVAGLALLTGGCASYVPPPSNDIVYHHSAWAEPPAPAAPAPVVIEPAPVRQPTPAGPSAVHPEVLDVSPRTLVYATDPTPAARTETADRRHVVKAGETLFSIARDHLGDGKRWREIVDLNPGLSAQTLRAGQTLVLP